MATTLVRYWKTSRRRLRRARREARLRQESAHPAIAISIVGLMVLATIALVVYVLLSR